MIAPEFVQHDCTGDKPGRSRGGSGSMTATLHGEAQIAEQDAALTLMGRGQADPYAQAADIVVGLLSKT